MIALHCKYLASNSFTGLIFKDISGLGVGLGSGLLRFFRTGVILGLCVGLVEENLMPDLWINPITLFLVRFNTSDISLAVCPSLTILMALSFSLCVQMADLIITRPERYIQSGNPPESAKP
jgi:hypothetical protein